MIGKCNIFVATTRALNPNDGSGYSALMKLPTDKVVATMNTLKAK
jgi:hypothetical protein